LAAFLGKKISLYTPYPMLKMRVNRASIIFWSYILGNLMGDRLFTAIEKILATLIGNRDSDNLPAASSK
jgi:hypothetical protein